MKCPYCSSPVPDLLVCDRGREVERPIRQGALFCSLECARLHDAFDRRVISVSEELGEMLDQFARDTGQSVSKVVERVIAKGVK